MIVINKIIIMLYFIC